MKTESIRRKFLSAILTTLGTLAITASTGAVVAGCGGCCLVAGTLIATPGGLRAIEDIRVGDTVLSYDERRGVLVENRVVETHRKVSYAHVELALPGGGVLGATGNHKIYDPSLGVYVPAEQLAQVLVCTPGQAGARTVTPRWVVDPVFVYDLTLEGEPRSYLANGVVVHNKKGEDGTGSTNAARLDTSADRKGGSKRAPTGTSTGTTTPGALPDLSEAFSATSGTAIRVGGTVTFTQRTDNLGVVPAGAFRNTLYSSPDATITTADLPVFSANISGLAPGQFTVPNPATPLIVQYSIAGVAFAGTFADDLAVVAESNEGNNTGTSVQVTISQ